MTPQGGRRPQVPLALRSERQSSAGRAGALRGAPDSQAQEDHRAAHGRAENGRRYSAPFFEPPALTEEEIQTQIAAGHRPPLEDIVGLSLEKKVQTWDPRHLYVWSHLPITIMARKRGEKNKATNNQRRDD